MSAHIAIQPSSELPDEVTPFYRAGQGSPLVLLHGATMSWRAWSPVLPFLVGRHEVFAPTLPGHRGGPALPENDPSMPALVDAVCRQLDEAGIETAHLAGNSLGGWLAFELARRGRARSVTAVSPAGSWRARRDLTRLLLLFRLGAAGVGRPGTAALARFGPLRRAVLRTVVARPGQLTDADVQWMIDDMVACPLLELMLGGGLALEPMEEFDVAICPVRVAWAERDRVIPFRRYGLPLRKVVGGAEFTMLPAVGHVPMFDDPRLVARTILELTSAVDDADVLEPAARRRAPWSSRRRSA